MADAKKHDGKAGSLSEIRTSKTIAAIDEGVRDAEAGRTVPLDEVHRRLPQWITDSSSRKER